MQERSESPRALSLILFLALAAVVTRLPQLLSPHLVLDGDEAILSLMARRAIRFESFPLYFDGQKYGFSSLETLWAALSFAAFGAQTIVLKLAMLSIWVAAATGLCLALCRLAGQRAAWVAALLIVTCPGWGPWSMKARGGYLTALLLVQVCRWILARSTAGPLARANRRETFTLGLCASGALIAQPIWFLSLAPWLLVFMWRHRMNPKAWIDGFAGATVTLIAVVLPGVFLQSGSWSPSLFNAPDLLAAVREFPQLVTRAFSGAYYLRQAVDGSPYGISATLWIAAFAFAAARTLFAPGIHATAQRATLAGTLLVAGFALPTLTPRYLLPVLDALVFVLAIQSAATTPRTSARRANTLLVTILAITGLTCMWSFRNLCFTGDDVVPTVPSERAALTETLAVLEEHGVRGVYTLDPLLQWILIDASAEQLPARWKAATERTPIYIDRFEQAADSGARVALVAYKRQRPLIEATAQQVDIIEVAGRFILVLDPSGELLEVLGFDR
ncbi:MAG: hypothetical protein ACI8QZ_001899 [Chlamydiales bacterium]|jgi:hypothetical protein